MDRGDNIRNAWEAPIQSIDLSVWQPDDTELTAARNAVVRDIADYLTSGECPEPEQAQELFETRCVLLMERDPVVMRDWIQSYFLETFYYPITGSSPAMREAISGDETLPEIVGFLWPLMARVLGIKEDETA